MKILLTIGKNVAAQSDKISLAGVWLFTTATALIKKHIWDPPEAIWFLFVAYHIGFFLELFWQYKNAKLSWTLIRKKILAVTGSLIGAVMLLYVATGVARYSVLFFWMPQAVMALLMAAIALTIIKYASKLEIISKQVASFLELKINSTTQKLKQDESNPDTSQTPVEQTDQQSTGSETESAN